MFSKLFGDKQTLVVYSYMYGPKRQQPCPMCTSLLSAWNGVSADVEQRIALAVVARSPIDRLPRLLPDVQWHILSGRKTHTQNLRQCWCNLPHVDGPEISTVSDAGSGNEKCCVHFRIFR
jgi:hypothetical protein